MHSTNQLCCKPQLRKPLKELFVCVCWCDVKLLLEFFSSFGLQEKSTNVKSIAAMFSGVPSPMEETENSLGPSALKSILERRKGFESTCNAAPGITPKKPTVPKPGLVPKAPPNEVKPLFVKPVGGLNKTAISSNIHNQVKEERNVFPKPSPFKPPSHQTEEAKVLFPKPGAGRPFVPVNNASQETKFGGFKSTFPPEPKGIEEKPAFPKPSQLKPLNLTLENESKPPFQKKPPFGVKPSVNVGGSPSENNFNKHNQVTKTFSGSQPIKQIKEPNEDKMPASPSSQPFHGVPLRPVGIKQIKSPFLNKSMDEPNDSSKSNFIAKDFPMKTNQIGNNSSPFGPKHFGQDNLREPKDPNEPKRKPLPSLAKLGPPPQKPTRPPNVDIERYRTGRGSGKQDFFESLYVNKALYIQFKMRVNKIQFIVLSFSIRSTCLNTKCIGPISIFLLGCHQD